MPGEVVVVGACGDGLSKGGKGGKGMDSRAARQQGCHGVRRGEWSVARYSKGM